MVGNKVHEHMWQSHAEINHCVFQSLHSKRRIAELLLRVGLICSYALLRLIRYSCIYEACMSPALSGSSTIRRLKHSNMIKIHNRTTFEFHTGLPHTHTHIYVYIHVHVRGCGLLGVGLSASEL